MDKYFRISKKLPRHDSCHPRCRATKRIHRASVGRLVLGQRTLAMTLLILFCCVSFLYLMLVNARETKGFEIKSLENSISELQKSQRQLEYEAADLQSIQHIQKEMNMSEFVPTTNVSYLKQENGVAVTGSNGGQ